MRNLFQILIVSCILTGCIITYTDELHTIIYKNLEIYKKKENIEFTNIAAIFKSYANLINSKEYRNLSELKKDSKIFINNLGDKQISENYPVVANKSEIEVVNILISDLINYINLKKITPKQFKYCINKTTTIYISEIINNEQIY